jgi:hypothetical protein
MWRAVEFVVWQKRSAIVCPVITNVPLGTQISIVGVSHYLLATQADNAISNHLRTHQMTRVATHAAGLECAGLHADRGRQLGTQIGAEALAMVIKSEKGVQKLLSSNYPPCSRSFISSAFSTGGDRTCSPGIAPHR